MTVFKLYEEVQKWMRRQTIHCLIWGDEVIANWYEHKAWEPYLSRRLYKKDIDKVSFCESLVS